MDTIGTRLDQWLVGVVEKLSHKIQRLTGITCCYLGCFIEFFSVLLFLDLRSNIVFSKDLIQGSTFATMCRDAPALFWFMVIVGLVDSLFVFIREKRAFQRLKAGYANPSKKNFMRVLTRVLYELLFVFFFLVHFLGRGIVFYDVLVMFVIVLALLLEACDPLPPSESKIKEWMKNIKEFRLKRFAGLIVK